MDIEKYQPNSHKSKETVERTDEKKKLEKVVTGQVKTKKKRLMRSNYVYRMSQI